MQTINTQDGLFHDGNPSTGELGTIVPAGWLNSIQAELLSVLAAASITPSDTKLNQVADAIKKLAWNSTSTRPSTLAGYGITDAAPINSPALTGAPAAPTPPQFDNSTRLATMAALNRMGLQASKFYRASGGGTLGLDMVGGTVQINGTPGPITLNPPLTAGVITGGRIEFVNSNSYAATVVAQTGDSLYYTTAASATTGITLQPGDSLTIECQGPGIWLAVGGSAANGQTNAGQVAYFAGQTPPLGWLKANGAAVSRTAYAALFAAIGTTYGVGDGSTTFNLPDLRGEFVRGWDDGRGVDAGRTYGGWQKGSLVLTETSINTSTDAMANLMIYGGVTDASAKATLGVDTFNAADYAGLSYVKGTGPYSTAPIPGTGGDTVTTGSTRPRNVTLLACIKY